LTCTAVIVALSLGGEELTVEARRRFRTVSAERFEPAVLEQTLHQGATRDGTFQRVAGGCLAARDTIPFTIRGGAMRTSALFLVALLAGGCEAASGPSGPVGAVSFANGVPGYLPSATGHAEISTTYGGQPLWQAYSFTAQRVGKAQTVIGEWSLRQDLGGELASVQGRVRCFVAVDTMARIAGEIRRSDNPAYPPGTFMVFKVVDQGEGTNEPRDIASAALPSEDPDNFCGGANPDMYEIETGNIQVHGFIEPN
jgi:hypothetical protein